MMLPPILDSFIKKNPKALVINIAAIVLFLFVSLTYFVFPLKEKNGILKQDKTGDESALAAQQLIIAKKNSLKTQVDKLNIAIPNDPQILKLGASLQIMAVKNGMFLKTINFKDSASGADTKKTAPVNQDEFDMPAAAKSTPNSNVVSESLPKEDAKTLNTTNFTVTVVGSGDNFKKFVQTIETNLRLIDLIEMQTPKETESGENNTYTLDLNGYYISGNN